MSRATETSELSPQSLTDILAEGDGRVTEYLTRHKRGPGGINEVKSYISHKEEK